MERKANMTYPMLSKQLELVINRMKDFSKLVVAYEPVWAIGTGDVATPQHAQRIHDYIRHWVHNHTTTE